MNATTAITGQDDSDVEGDESFTVEIASVTNGVEDSTPQEETITITDDDTPAPSIAFDDSGGSYPNNVGLNRDIEITFSEAVQKIDNSALVNTDLAGLITFKFDDMSGDDAGFTATINAAKTEITIVPDELVSENKLFGRRNYYVAFDGTQVETQAAQVPFTNESSIFNTADAGTPGAVPNLAVGTVTGNSVQLNWTGATNNGERYLLYASSTSNLSDGDVASDGDDPGTIEDPDVGDGDAVVILDNQIGPNSYTFMGLNALTEYRFRILPFNNFNSNWEYRQSNDEIETVTTDCLAPAVQASNIAFGATNAASMNISWQRGDGDGVIVIAREGAAVTFVPANGNGYPSGVDSNFDNASAVGTDTKIVFRGNGNNVLVTGLDASTTYHFAIYEYNDTDNCYNLAGPLTGSNATNAPSSTSTISGGTGPDQLPATASGGSRIAVFSFTVEDQGDDGRDTNIEEIVFTQIGVDFTSTNLSNLIRSADLRDDDANFTQSNITISGDQITISNIPTGQGTLGNVDEGTSKTYTLSILFKNPLMGGLGPVVDGRHLIFSVQTSDIQTQASESSLAPSQSTNSDAIGAPNNEIVVEATELRFIQQPSDVFVFSTMSPDVTLEATDANGNRDLDYTGTVDITSLGTLQATPTASFVAGLGTYGTVSGTEVIHTVAETGRTLSTANSNPLLTEAGPSNPFNVFAPVTNSDIVADGGFVYAENIPYINHQEAGNIVVSGSSIEVAAFTIRDGGSGANDGDELDTELTEIEFTLTNPTYIRRLALYVDEDLNPDYETEIAEAVVSGNTVTFTGISITAPDDGNKNFVLRASFTNTVEDNEQFSFTIDRAEANPASSGFATSNAGNASSSVTGDDNKIEVIATRQRFTTQPDSPVRQGFPIPTQPVVIAEDINNIQDLDYNGTVTVTNTDNLSMVNVPASYSNGTLTFSGFQYDGEGDGTLTVASSPLSSVVSNSVFVDGTAPTAVISDDQAIDKIVKENDVVNIAVAFTENDQINETLAPMISIGSVITNQPMVRDNNLNWTFEWTVPGGNDGPAAITITASDRVGNPLGTVTGVTSYTIDNTAPTVSTITTLDDNPTNATSVRFQVVFQEDVTGVDISDFRPTAGTVTTGDVTGTGDTYIVTVRGLAGITADVGLHVLGNPPSGTPASIFDIAGNAYVANFDSGQTYQLDNTPPVIQAISPFSPADDSFNNSVNTNLVVRFSEDIRRGVGTIRLRLTSDDSEIETYNPGELTFSTNELTIDRTARASLTEGTSYYILIDNDAVRDAAGNDFAGISDKTIWDFTTFATPIINGNGLPDAGCVGQNITINGNFLTGVTIVRFNGPAGLDAANFTIINDTQITAGVPFYNGSSLNGQVYIEKPNNDNPGDPRSATSAQTLEVGPSRATITQAPPANNPVCSSGTTTQTQIQIEIIGGNGPYSIDYNVGSFNNDYINNQIESVTPPNIGTNTFRLNAVSDNSGAIGCPVPATELLGTFNVTLNQRPSIDAGAGGSIDYCPAAQGTTLILNNAFFGTETPSLTDVGSCPGPGCGVLWATDGGDGAFTNSTTLLNARYDIGTNDLLNGFVKLTLQSTNNPTACEFVIDTLTVNFISNATANPGGVGGELNFCWDGVSNPEVQLNGSVSGGSGPLWSVASGSDGSFQGNITNINNPVYIFGPNDVVAGEATVRLTPDGGSCGSGVTSDLRIVPIEIPDPSFQSPKGNVCINEAAVVYQVQNRIGSSYEWMVTGATTSGNDIVGQGTSAILLNWESTPGNFSVEVVETDLNGCISNPEVLPIVINDLPDLTFISPNIRAFDINADPVELIGGIVPLGSPSPPNEVDGDFMGTSVFFINDGGPRWFFDPSSAGLTTPSNEHQITFLHTDANGCTGSVSEDFVVRDGQSSLLDVSDLTIVLDEYCEDANSFTITLNPSSGIMPQSDGSFTFRGPGIDQNVTNVIGGGDVEVTAVLNPKQAFSDAGELGPVREITIFYQDSVTRGASREVRRLGQRTVTINAKPSPNETLREVRGRNFCEDADTVTLLVDNVISGGETALISSPNQANTIRQINAGTFEFIPGNVMFPMPGNDPDNNFAPQTVIVNYQYTASTGCDTLITEEVIVNQKPPRPLVNATEVCIIGDDIPRVSAVGVNVTNNVTIEGTVSIRWFNENGVNIDDGNELSETILQDITGAETIFVAQEVNGCLSETVRLVIEKVDDFDFAFNGSCLNPSSGIEFTQTTGPVSQLRWKVNNTVVSTQISPVVPSFTFNFPEPGLYDVQLEISTANGCIDSISKPIVVTSQETATNDITYFENFEDNNGSGWVGSGLNNTWAHGSPRAGNTSINLGPNSGSVIWITGLDGPYNKNEESFLYSPCFDLSDLDRPLLSFDYWVNTANGEDGVIVEYSTTGINGTWQRLGNFDNGIQSGINWYNQRDVSANPGDQSVGFFGWSGNSEGWLESKHSLDEIPSGERQEVLFRFSFKSTEGSDAVDKPDGFAIDNVFIGNRTRIILIENFTNTSQVANTLDEATTLDNFIGTTQERVVLNYHTAFPGEDPANADNTAATSARALYYGISEVPRARMDGTFRDDLGDLFSQWGTSEYGIRTLSNAPINLSIDPQVNGNVLDINISFTTLQDIAPNAVVHVAIVENDISITDDYNRASVPSGQTTLNAVVREMLPTAAGTKFENQIPEGETRAFTVSWQPTTQIFDPANVTIIAFVQDEVTREVYQTERIANVTLPSLVTSVEGELIHSLLSLYPNPANEEMIIRFKQPLQRMTPMVIFDTFGKLVFEKEVAAGTSLFKVDTRTFVPGMYHVKLDLPNGELVKQRLVIIHD
ncbi:Ig-like domain-containing protein [Fulvivirga sp. M361]|uniref:Ig-like domain-containing protein n=1 Tax=Fulvivirga sp. M361 TaxID=2594266 RepID=UPI001C88CAFC|nr:Ig-like domain-containing protein [Fulvivirga sp. M361]